MKGPPGDTGPPGPPGPPGDAMAIRYPLTWIGGTKGPQADQPQGDDSASIFRDGEMMMVLKELTNTVESIKSPRGTSDKNPARSCLDIFLAEKQAGNAPKSGLRWIDPNGGSNADAIEVMCNFDTLETCVYPSNGVIPNGTHYVGDSGHLYYGAEMNRGEILSYSPPQNLQVEGADYTSQLTFLRLLSSKATQKVTFFCNGVVAYHDNRGNNKENALRLQGFGEHEFTAEGHPRHTYNVIYDGCADRSPTWDRTEIEFTTPLVGRMPIYDIAPADIGGVDQQFGAKFGPVCFK